MRHAHARTHAQTHTQRDLIKFSLFFQSFYKGKTIFIFLTHIDFQYMIIALNQMEKTHLQECLTFKLNNTILLLRKNKLLT